MPFNDFQVSALVYSPSENLRASVSENYGRRQLSRKGILVTSLRWKEDLSVALAPDSWDEVARPPFYRHRPKPGAVMPPMVFDVPEDVAMEQPVYRLEATELTTDGRRAQVVTDYSGGRLSPYMRYSPDRRHRSQNDHASSSVFSAAELGILSWERCRHKGEEAVTLKAIRARIAVEDGLLVYRQERVFGATSAKLLRSRFGSLPEQYSAWNAAHEALYERMHCTVPSCEGHYHEE